MAKKLNNRRKPIDNDENINPKENVLNKNNKEIYYSTESAELILEKAHNDDVGHDIKANTETDIQPGEFKTISTGIKLDLTNGNVEAEIRSRSGLASKYGIAVLNSPGTIDPGYKGEVKVILINHGKNYHSK